jgi:hypothetical protein
MYKLYKGKEPPKKRDYIRVVEKHLRKTYGEN